MGKTTKGRVDVGKTAEDILIQTTKVYEKHRADGESSILKTMADHDWDASGPKIVIAQQHHSDAVKYKQLMEQSYRERDKYLPELDDINRATATYLKGVYPKNPKKLSDWGYSVDDTPPSAGKGKGQPSQ